VDAGTYPEQVKISQNTNNVRLDNLKLKGADQASIITLPTAFAGSQTTIIVEISGAQNVRIDGFTIEGPGNGTGSIGYGIEVDQGGSAIITNNHITHIRDNPFSGDQNGVGIEVGRASTFQTGTATIDHNTIDDYQKGGIVVSNTGSSADIENNTVIGAGPTALIAQNGIQVSDGAAAEVSYNKISGNVYTLQTVVSTGILLFNPGAVTVDHNTVSKNDVGVYSFGATSPNINHNEITRNTFNGIILDTTTGAQVKYNLTNNNGFGDLTGNPTGDGGIALFNSKNNTVDHNTSNNNKGDGVFVDSASTGNVFTYNHLNSNSIFDAEDQSVGHGTAGTGNFWDDNRGTKSSPPGLFEPHRHHDEHGHGDSD
jgi:parallel beta-helix repeat protein